CIYFFFSSRRRHTRSKRDWSSDVCSSDLEKGTPFMPLFVVLKEGTVLDQDLKKQLKQQVRDNCSPRHIPDDIYEIKDVPRTLNGKKLEVPIKNILIGKSLDDAVSKDALSNPESLDFFIQFAQEIEKNS